MNFAMCQQAPGQWLMLKGIARRYEFRQGQYGLYALGDLEDQTGRKEQMMFGGNDKNPLPQQSLLNTPCVFAVQWDANKQKYKAYFKSFSNGQPQAAPPQAPRQQAAQSNGRDQSIEKQCTWKGSCDVVAAMITAQMAEVNTLAGIKFALADLCVLGHDWIATGNVGGQPADDGPPPSDDDIPF